MRASDLLRDLLEPGAPAKAANPANSRASTTFAGLRMAANGCESAADDVSHSQDSQPFANAESKQPCGFSQDSQDSQDSQADGLRNPAAPCPVCGCGSYWNAADGWHCEGCAPPPDGAERWFTVSGGKPAPLPAPAVPWPAELTADLRRVSTAFEWSRQDIADFCRWARRSPEALADAAAFLHNEAAKLPG